MNLGAGVKRVLNNDYVSYRLDASFADLQFQKNRMQIWLNMRFGELGDPKRLCKDVSGRGHLGNGDVQLFYDGKTPLDDVMALVGQACRLQERE
jgi:predicted transport protein